MLKVACKLGGVVSLSDERWKHVLSHPEMRGQRLRIKETLVDPDEIKESMQSPTTCLFYKLYPKTPVTTKYMLVVVKALTEKVL